VGATDETTNPLINSVITQSRDLLTPIVVQHVDEVEDAVEHGQQQIRYRQVDQEIIGHGPHATMSCETRNHFSFILDDCVTCSCQVNRNQFQLAAHANLNGVERMFRQRNRCGRDWKPSSKSIRKMLLLVATGGCVPFAVDGLMADRRI
jgi:hypothetical protein